MPVVQKQTQYASFWLCEEVVQLWRLVCLNPDLRLTAACGSGPSRFPSGSSAGSSPGGGGPGRWLLQQLVSRLRAFHLFALEQAGIAIASPLRSLATTTSSGSRVPILAATGEDDGDDKASEQFFGFKPALAACSITWPSELPPSSGLTIEEFRALVPAFFGARPQPCSGQLRPATWSDFPGLHHLFDWLGTNKSLDGVIAMDDVIAAAATYGSGGGGTGLWDYQQRHFFSNLPRPANELELAYSRFQALDAHGHKEQALLWARYLALRLLHLAPGYTGSAELAAFKMVSDGQTSTVSPPTTSVAPGQAKAQATPLGGRSVAGGGARRNKRQCPTMGDGRQRTRGTVRGTAGADTPAGAHRSELAAVAVRHNQLAVEWANKTSRLLDQIRYLIKCLCQAYHDSLPNPNLSSANRITSSGRSLLTYRGGLDPACCLQLRLENQAAVMHTQPRQPDSGRIEDEWTRFDIELAFRLGFYGLSLPRPPCLSPTLEVRLFDQEVGLLTRLCGLPLHLACPRTALRSIRQEASRIAHELSAYEADISVPYNTAAFVFHQLVGIHSQQQMAETSSGAAAVVDLSQSTGMTFAGPSADGSASTELEAGPASRASQWYPVLATGAILSGSGRPLAVYAAAEEQEGPLGGAVAQDAELGFQAVLRVLSCQSRVPESAYHYFVESQRAQLDALAIYLLGHYRDNLDRLDRILAPLLDRRYNPYFKAPPLWACFNLPPADLIQFGESRQPSPPPPPNHATSDGIAAAAVSHDLDGSAPIWLVASGTENFPPDAPPPPVPSTSQPSTESPEGTGFYVDEQQEQQPGVAASHTKQTSVSEDTDTVSDSKLWMDTFRCVTLGVARRRTRPSVGMAAVDTSAPETTSSDNSPAVGRRFHFSPPVAADASDSPVVAMTTSLPETTTIEDESGVECKVAGESTAAVPDQLSSSAKGPGNHPVPNSSFFSSSSSSSDTSSSSASSESLVTSSGGRDEEELPGETDGPAAAVLLSDALESASGAAAGDSPATESIKSPPNSGHPPAVVVGQRHSTWPAGCLRPPAQPLSDSLAFHTFNFSKLVRRLAGGPTATGLSVFVPEPSEQSAAVHRNLLLVSFQIGLYGLGLYNALTPSWRSRTYSRNGNWIGQLVFEIGIPAAGVLYHCWRNHLTATELANIAFQLSLKNDRSLVDIAVELCLASLTMCVTLKPHEIYRALTQCEEHQSASLERGLLCVETSDQEHRASTTSTASTTGLLPEIYFHLARNWFSLYQATGHHHQDDEEEDLEHKLASTSLAPGQEATSTDTPLTPSLVYQTLVSGGSGSAAATHPTGFFPGSGVSTSSYSAPPPPMSFSVSAGSRQLQVQFNPYMFYPPPAHGGMATDGPQSTSSLVYFSSPQFGAVAAAQHQSYPYQAAVGSSGGQGTSMFVYSGDCHHQHLSTPGLVPMNPGTGVGPPPTESAAVGDLVSAIGLTGALFPPGTASNLAAGRPCCPPPVYSVPLDPSMTVFSPPPPPGITFAYPTVSMGDHLHQQHHHLYQQAPVSSSPGLPPGSMVDSHGHATSLTVQQPSNRSSSPVEAEHRGDSLSSSTAVDCVGGSSGEPLLQALEGKRATRRYLVRAYHCATYAIRLLYVPSVLDSTSSSSGASATPGLHTSTGSTAPTSGGSSSRGGVGARNRHHYHGNHGSTAGGTLSRSFGSPAVVAGDTPGHRRGGGGTSWNSLDGGHQQSQYNNNRSTIVDGTTVAPSSTNTSTSNTTVSSYPTSAKTNDANILWTLKVAIRLGPSTVREYCNLLMHCIHCPLVMNQVTQNTIDYYKRRHRQQETRTTTVDPSGDVATTATTTSSAYQFWVPAAGQAHGHMPMLVPSHPGKFFYPQQQVVPQQPALLGDGPTYQLGNWVPFPATAAALWPRMSSGHPVCSPHQQQPLVLGHGEIPFPPPASIPPPTWNTNSNSVPPQALSYHHQQQHGMLPAFLGMPSSGVTNAPPPVAPPVVANRMSVGQVGYAVQQQHQYQQPQQQQTVPLASNATRRLSSVLGMRVNDEGMELIERLVNRTHDLFHRYIDYRLQYTGLAQSDWDELVELILQAYSVHWGMPATEAGLHWNSLLTRIRRHHKCTNALWQRIFAGIQTADLKRATT